MLAVLAVITCPLAAIEDNRNPPIGFFRFPFEFRSEYESQLSQSYVARVVGISDRKLESLYGPRDFPLLEVELLERPWDRLGPVQVINNGFPEEIPRQIQWLKNTFPGELEPITHRTGDLVLLVGTPLTEEEANAYNRERLLPEPTFDPRKRGYEFDQRYMDPDEHIVYAAGIVPLATEEVEGIGKVAPKILLARSIENVGPLLASRAIRAVSNRIITQAGRIRHRFDEVRTDALWQAVEVKQLEQVDLVETTGNQFAQAMANVLEGLPSLHFDELNEIEKAGGKEKAPIAFAYLQMLIETGLPNYFSMEREDLKGFLATDYYLPDDNPRYLEAILKVLEGPQTYARHEQLRFANYRLVPRGSLDEHLDELFQHDPSSLRSYRATDKGIENLIAPVRNDALQGEPDTDAQKRYELAVDLIGTQDLKSLRGKWRNAEGAQRKTLWIELATEVNRYVDTGT
jgi:hypothetical protein